LDRTITTDTLLITIKTPASIEYLLYINSRICQTGVVRPVRLFANPGSIYQGEPTVTVGNLPARDAKELGLQPLGNRTATTSTDDYTVDGAARPDDLTNRAEPGIITVNWRFGHVDSRQLVRPCDIDDTPA
jgi:hypothetical protein